MKMKAWLFFFVLLVTPICVAEAQKIIQLKVRLTNGNRVCGALLRSGQDSLLISDRRNSRRIDLGVSEIQSIRVQGTVKTVNVFIGASTGAAAGAILEMVLQSPLNCQECHLLEPEMAGFGDIAVLGLFVGGVTGALVGEPGKRFKIHGDRIQFGLFLDYISYEGLQVKAAAIGPVGQQ